MLRWWGLTISVDAVFDTVDTVGSLDSVDAVDTVDAVDIVLSPWISAIQASKATRKSTSTRREVGIIT